MLRTFFLLWCVSAVTAARGEMVFSARLGSSPAQAAHVRLGGAPSAAPPFTVSQRATSDAGKLYLLGTVTTGRYQRWPLDQAGYLALYDLRGELLREWINLPWSPLLVAVDPAGSVYVASDAALRKYDSRLEHELAATPVPRGIRALDVSTPGQIRAAGATWSDEFPSLSEVSEGMGLFLIRLHPRPGPLVSPGCIANAASLVPVPLASWRRHLPLPAIMEPGPHARCPGQYEPHPAAYRAHWPRLPL